MSRRISFRPLIFLVLCLLVVMYLARTMSRQGDITYSAMRENFVQEKVQSFTVSDSRLTATLKDQTTVTCPIRDFTLFYDDLNDLVVEQYSKGIITQYDYPAAPGTNWLQVLLPYVLAIMAFILLMNLMTRMNGGGAGGVSDKMAHFGEARVSSIPEGDKKVTFKDVAGADEEKEELQEIVEFLRDPEKYLKLGAHIPKGVLLVGPPGTGKTLLAKAVAGEAGVKFLSISGSDFVEMYVGVGASRVRDLFVQAKKDAPAIVFIDEIDAVGRQRGSGLGGGHDEREQTLNQLLTEMDGFEDNSGVIILAATNRPESLDPALTRPGRFDRRVPVELPDLKGREEILKVHARKIKVAEDVDFSVVARMASGASGAELANIVNEAALRAVRKGRKLVTQEDMLAAFEFVIAGSEKKNSVLTEFEKKLVAYHEVGHAIQHATNYAPVKIRTAIVPITNLGAKLSVPLIILGLILSSFGEVFVTIAYIGCALYGLVTIFQLVTLPTEFNASSRALKTIEETNLLQGEEFRQAKQVLSAAAMTYVAALAVSLAQLMRFLIIVGGRRND